MARKVFFSFHYKRDSIRVSQIRECNSITNHFERTPFLVRSEWETIKSQGGKAIEKWINTNMSGCGVIVVCFGLETHTRPWVKYELEKAHKESRGIIAIDMSGMKNMQSQIDPSGLNPLYVAWDEMGNPLIFNNKYRTYHWINDGGRNSIDEWINNAARLVGR